MPRKHSLHTLVPTHVEPRPGIRLFAGPRSTIYSYKRRGWVENVGPRGEPQWHLTVAGAKELGWRSPRPQGVFQRMLNRIFGKRETA